MIAIPTMGILRVLLRNSPLGNNTFCFSWNKKQNATEKSKIFAYCSGCYDLSWLSTFLKNIEKRKGIRVTYKKNVCLVFTSWFKILVTKSSRIPQNFCLKFNKSWVPYVEKNTCILNTAKTAYFFICREQIKIHSLTPFGQWWYFFFPSRGFYLRTIKSIHLVFSPFGPSLRF